MNQRYNTESEVLTNHYIGKYLSRAYREILGIAKS